LRDDWEFVSIDYSAATDNIESELTMEALKTTVVRVGPSAQEEAWLRACVEPHYVTYPPKVKTEPVMQQNGQLMGSPVSFPLLCKINAATIRAADKELGLDNLPFIVNGDDALVYRPRDWRPVHQRLARAAGLTYSVGKVYCSGNYANVNSVGFWISNDAGELTCQRLDYIPIGLMRGHHKVSSTVSEDGEVKEEGGAIGALKQTLAACTERPCFALAKFLTLNKKDLTEALRGRNLFVSEPEGGIGLTPPQGWKYTITDDQIDMCARATVDLWPADVAFPRGVEKLMPCGAKLERRPFGTDIWIIEDNPWTKPTKAVSTRRVPKPAVKPRPHIGPWLPVSVDLDPLSEA
jgi:hypothetical protein